MKRSGRNKETVKEMSEPSFYRHSVLARVTDEGTRPGFLGDTACFCAFKGVGVSLLGS